MLFPASLVFGFSSFFCSGFFSCVCFSLNRLAIIGIVHIRRPAGCLDMVCGDGFGWKLFCAGLSTGSSLRHSSVCANPFVLLLPDFFVPGYSRNLYSAEPVHLIIGRVLTAIRLVIIGSGLLRAGYNSDCPLLS